MSKHQELCCGCKYDDIDNDCYLQECCECEYTQGDEEPTNYIEEYLSGEK